MAVTDAANFAIAVFNDGDLDYVKLYKELGIENGVHMFKHVLKTDLTRLYHAKRKSGDIYQTDRKRRWAMQKGFTDKKAEEEGNVYETGAHWYHANATSAIFI